MLSKRVVLADDNPEILSIEEQILGSEYSVVGAYMEGQSLLEYGLQLKPDLAVLDIGMGPSNGLELAKQIRERNPSIHIVFLTVHEEPEFIQAGLQAGASAYVFKRNLPVDLLKGMHAAVNDSLFISCEE